MMMNFKIHSTELAKSSKFRTFLKSLISIVIISEVAAEHSRKLDIMRERIRRLEGRLAEDISLLREEFYNEISALVENEVTGENESIPTFGSAIKIDDELEALTVKVETLKNELLAKMRIITDGNNQEKRIRREIQEEINGLKIEKIDLVTEFSGMLNNITSTISDTVEKICLGEKLNEIVELLENLNVQLTRNVQTIREKDNKDTEKVSDCADWLRKGHVTSGVYTVFSEALWRPIKVYCDMETLGGGWTVFQRRQDGSENFDRKWVDYAYGFGNLSGEFWLGNEFIHRITSVAPQELLIELEDFENDHRHAAYGLFSVGSVEESFKLSVNFFIGNVTDSFVSTHNGLEFSTSDHGPSSGCSRSYKGGWWYGKCHSVNINGLYLKGKHSSYADGINWSGWRGHHYSLKKTEMKFRPH